MGANVVVVLAPRLDDDDRFPARSEPLDAETLVAEFAVEALVGAVLPGLARIDQRRLDVLLHDPLQDRLADELGAIVGAQEGRSATLADQTAQNLNDAPGADAASHIDRQALSGVLVDDREALELLAVGTAVEDEVVSPDAIRGKRWQGARA